MRKRKIAFAAAAAVAAVILVGLAGCTSPFLLRIEEEIARAPFTGTAYKFVREWGNTDPAHAFNEPIVRADTAANVYVADSSFRIRKFDTSGTLLSTVGGVTTLGPNARMYDMAFDAAGNRYITTRNDSGSGPIAGVPQIQKYDASGKLLAEWATSDTLYNGTAISGTQGIAVDSGGNIYVVDTGNHRIVKFNSSLSYVTAWGGSTPYGPSGIAINSNPAGIAVENGTTTYIYLVDTNNDRIIKFDAVGTYITEWGGSTTYPAAGGTTMSFPKGIAFGTISFTNYLFVADTNNDRIIQFDSSGNYITSWGSSTDFNNPNSVTLDSQGRVYVADQGPSGGFGFFGRITKYDISSTPTKVATWGGSSASAKGLLSAPWGIAFDPSGNLVVSEVANKRLQKFDAAGNWLATWTSSSLAAPTGLTVDPQGNVYVTDINGSHYEVFGPSGSDRGSVGSSGTGNGTFGEPLGIAADTNGFLYVTDPGNALIEKFGTDGFYKNVQWGGFGTGDGQFAQSDLGGNYAIAVDPAGYVYVSDYVADRIQKFDFTGKFIMKFGKYGTDPGDLNAPIGMAVDRVGNLYVCDMLNHRVQKFSSNGTYLATIGGVGVDNGGFGWPVGVAVDAAGNVAVTDYVGGLVQVFAPTF